MKNTLFFTDRESLDSYTLSNQFAEHLEFILVKTRQTVTMNDMYYALSLSIRDRLVRNWLRTQYAYNTKDVKRVYYLSLEFLMGRILGNALISMDYYEECRKILRQDDYVLEDIIEIEHDMALGNGGLGRLAACFLDSMATLQLPAFGYGIRYEFGIFKQDIVNGRQVEQPDYWLAFGNPWEIPRRELTFKVRFFGRVVTVRTPDGTVKHNWIDTEDILALAYDVPVPGYKSDTVNNLRLWAARANQEFNFKDFNEGNYVAAVEGKNISENISKVLYPNDSYTKGKFLRLKQQYFFSSASLQDIIRKYRIKHDSFDEFPEKVAIQLNDTHPVIAIPELMRILIDEHNMPWEEAWTITTGTFAYTNHTVVPEALEEWSVSIFEELLPRHLQIIYEINQHFLDEVRENYHLPDDVISRISIIRESPEKKIRMAHLAIVSCHSINGVAALHSDILKQLIFNDFYKIYPEKFKNVTNGITFRRWIRHANPLLSSLISDRIGDDWILHNEKIRDIEKFIDDPEFLNDWSHIKWFNKQLLAKFIKSEYGISVSTDSIFDVQIKRFHEYKRQLLNVLHVITLYNRIKENPRYDATPRTVIFAGKAAPAYTMAKLVIRLIHAVADVVNNDPAVGDKLKVVFIANYGVSLAEKIIPAADLSEQISTAGLEASGTGNMKFALNGALTIGTMDGANIEIREEVGDENIFIFGLLADQVLQMRASGYNPREYYDRIPELRRVINMLAGNYFAPAEPGIFQPLVDSLMGSDYYMLFADYEDYCRIQREVAIAYKDRERWARMSLLNTARIAKFSSDRAIKDYAKHIWGIKPVKVKVKQSNGDNGNGK